MGSVIARWVAPLELATTDSYRRTAQGDRIRRGRAYRGMIGGLHHLNDRPLRVLCAL
jgi:hypothetical protein